MVLIKEITDNVFNVLHDSQTKIIPLIYHLPDLPYTNL